jgi:glycerol kinase
VDGGAARNDLLMQFQADLLGVPVIRPAKTEVTAFGAAALAGHGAGIWRDERQLAALWTLDKRFDPRMSRDEASARRARWHQAVDRSRSWAEG